MKGSVFSLGLRLPIVCRRQAHRSRFREAEESNKSGGSWMRWLAGCALRPLVLLLMITSPVTGGLMARSWGVPGVASAQGLDDPEGAGRGGQGLRRPAPEPLAALRSRWPVRGPVTSGFGPRGSFWDRHFHPGIDIGAPRGTAVHAPVAGEVAFAGWRHGYGRTVIVDHGHQVRSLYGHLAQLDVRAGQTVAAGAEIGLTGTTGHSSGPHLHYEVLMNGHPVNPRASPSAGADFRRPRWSWASRTVRPLLHRSGQRSGSTDER